MTVGVLDHPRVVELFGRLEGRRFLGVVDCGDCLELVFESGPMGNLVTLYTDAGRHTGLIALGGVADPADYVREWREFREAA